MAASHPSMPKHNPTEIDAMFSAATSSSPQDVAALEAELRAIFATMFPESVLHDSPGMQEQKPEELMRLFERWNPVAIQLAFLRHVGRVGLTKASPSSGGGTTASSQQKKTHR